MTARENHPAQPVRSRLRLGLLGGAGLLGSLGVPALWFTPAAAAQDQQPAGSGKRRAKLEIELPAAPVPGTPDVATPEGLVRSLLPELAAYPGGKSDGAIDELVLAGRSVIPPLRTVLEGIQFQARLAAAQVLARLGDVDSAPVMEELLMDRRAAPDATALLGAIARLEPGRAQRLAVRFAGDGPAALRAPAFRYLGRHMNAGLAPDLVPLLESRQPAVRRQAFELLATQKELDLSAECLLVLGDDDSQLAAAATARLVAMHGPGAPLAGATRDALAALVAEEPPSRRSMWALLTLCELEERQNERFLPAELAPRWIARLRSADPLLRLSSAIALGQLGFRGELEGGDAVLSEQVLPAIMESFLRNEYFKDYMPLFTMAAARVTRITGLDLGEDLTRWRAAWLGEGGAPLIRRDLDPARLGEAPALREKLVITYEARGMLCRGPEEEITLLGPGWLAEPERPAPDALILGAGEMERLVAALLASRALERGRAPLGGLGAEGGAAAAESGRWQSLTVALDNRERSVLVRAPDDPAMAAARAALGAARDQAFWQRLYFGDPARFPEFYAAQAPRFAAAADPADGQRALVHAVEIGLPLLSPPERTATLLVLWRVVQDPARMGPEEIRLILHGLEQEPVPEGAATVAVALAARSGDPAVFPVLAEFLIGRFGESGLPLLKRAIRALDRFDAALDDPRLLLRIAALEEAAEGGGLAPERVLAALLDADPRVRRAAILALGASGDDAHVARLLELAAGSDPVLRRVALEALGRLGSAAALQVLREAAESPEPQDAVAACRGLARVGGEAAIRVLEEAIVRDGARSQIGLSAMDTLADLGDRAARDVLLALLDADDPVLAEEAAYRLADLGELAAAPVLLAVTENLDRAGRARDALATLYSSDGGERGEEFVLRHRDHRDVTPDEWLARALDVTEASAEEAELVRGIPLKLLVRALRDPRWYVRQNAGRILSREFQRDLGAAYRFASDADVERLAKRWESTFALPAELR